LFISFLYRGLSLPAHKFLHGLLFLRRAAASDHAQFHLAHCVLYHAM
jgi:hypothetical protein